MSAVRRSATRPIAAPSSSYDKLGSRRRRHDHSFSGTFPYEPGHPRELRLDGGPSFFAQAGAGLLQISVKVSDSVLGDTSDSDGKFGFNVGAGVGFPVGPKTR